MIPVQKLPCDGVLFDLDGTLWDSTQQVTLSWRKALADQPDVTHLPTVEQITAVMGMTAEDLTETLMPELPLQRRMELFDRCAEVENEYLRRHGGTLYPGLTDLLKTLSKHVPLAVVSNCNRGYIDCFLEAHGLGVYFADWECNYG